jgi:hypothetical protein
MVKHYYAYMQTFVPYTLDDVFDKWHTLLFYAYVHPPLILFA